MKSALTQGDNSRDLKEISSLFEISRALNTSLDLKASLKETLAILSRNLGMTRGTITLLNPHTGDLQIELAHGLSQEAKKRGKYRIGEGITGLVVEKGEPMVIPRISEEPRFLDRTRSREAREKPNTAFICVPIKAGPRVLGALSVDRPFENQSALDEDLRLLTIIAAIVAQTVRNLQILEEEKDQLRYENIKLKGQLTEKYQVANIIGNSRKMREVFEMIQRVAQSPATVLIRGESGTGKELVASAIHYQSKRSARPFIKVNCAALPETLLESELFGHEKGAFSGALALKKGRFELAQEGTIFLDEIGDLNQNVQTKLLRVIQEREFERLGGTRTIACDVRIITATNQDLEKAVAEGRFREDLYYRLNGFPVFIPPLRERRADILLLAEHFLERYSRENKKEIKRISSPAIDLLIQYHWPGNVRELQNCIERAVLVCDEEAIKSQHLPPTLQTAESSNTQTKLPFKEAVEQYETELIVEALKEANGVQFRAAEILQTSQRILGYKITQYGIDPKKFKIP
jgi:Nif-specific regulatory protein